MTRAEDLRSCPGGAGCRVGDESGQSLVEFAVSAMLLLTIIFGMVDFSRILYVDEVVVNLTGEGSSLASRGTSLSATAAAVETAATPPLDFAGHGRVIVSSVYNNNNVLTLTGQSALGGLTATSRIGSTIGGTVSLPATARPQVNQTVFITEVFYTYHAITPFGTLLNIPSQIYDVAFY